MPYVMEPCKKTEQEERDTKIIQLLLQKTREGKIEWNHDDLGCLTCHTCGANIHFGTGQSKTVLFLDFSGEGHNYSIGQGHQDSLEELRESAFKKFEDYRNGVIDKALKALEDL